MNAAQLDDLMDREPAHIDRILEHVYSENDAPPTVAMMRDSAAVDRLLGMPSDTPGKALLNHLRTNDPEKENLLRVALLAANLIPGSDLETIEAAVLTGGIGPAEDDDFASDKLSTFIGRAEAFRCRILVDGQTQGSGAVISSRLVLTASHVVANNNQIIEVLDAGGKRHLAHVVSRREHHPDEETGGFPPTAQSDQFLDFALLRVERPIGFLLGTAPTTPTTANGQERRNLLLIHYPQGVRKGLCFGVYSAHHDHPRLMHTVVTDNGSSGAPGFDRDLNLVGLHQARWGNGNGPRRMVPFASIAQTPCFKQEFEADKPPNYLWSLDGSLDSHLVIGRDRFFDAITAILEGQSQIRGIWIQRTEHDESTGLTFGFTLLEQFLKLHATDHRAVRLSPESGTPDLIELLISETERVIGPLNLGAARSGVRADETTQTASDDDRARQVLSAISRKMEKTDDIFWLYVEPAPSRLTRTPQAQLEQILDYARRQSHIRIVVAGYEVDRLFASDFARFSDLDAARQSTRSGVLLEMLRDFRIEDVRGTLRELSRALGLGWQATQIDMLISITLGQLRLGRQEVFAPKLAQSISQSLRDNVANFIRGNN